MPNRTLQPSADKTEELIIYIASKLQEKPNYGSTLLGKTLYFVDSMNYLKKGKPISNLEYIKQDFGPTPEPAQYLPIRNRLELKGELEETQTDYFGKVQKRYIAKRQPVIEIFEKDELVLINDVIESIGDNNATDISDYTHRFSSWIIANHKEALPFYTFILTKKEPEAQDYEWAEKSMKRYLQNKNEHK